MRPTVDWRLRSAAIDDEFAAGFDDLGLEVAAARCRANAKRLRDEHESEYPPQLITWHGRMNPTATVDIAR